MIAGGILDPACTGGGRRVARVLRDGESLIYSFEGWPENLPRPYTAILQGDMRGDTEKTAELCALFVDAAAADLQDKKPLFNRSTHLIALPLLGSGNGGVRHVIGRLVRSLLVCVRRFLHSHTDSSRTCVRVAVAGSLTSESSRQQGRYCK
jgi:hypothetical protein